MNSLTILTFIAIVFSCASGQALKDVPENNKVDVVVIIDAPEMLTTRTFANGTKSFGDLDEAAIHTAEMTESMGKKSPTGFPPQKVVSTKDGNILVISFINGKFSSKMIDGKNLPNKMDTAIKAVLDMFKGSMKKKFLIVIGGHDSVKDSEKVHQFAKELRDKGVIFIHAQPGYFLERDIDYKEIERLAEEAVAKQAPVKATA